MDLPAKIQELNGRKTIRDRIVFYELNNPVDFLFWCTGNGFLLHGSPTLCLVLKPITAHDLHRDPGSKTAVYMADHPQPAMFMALASNLKGGYHVKQDDKGKISHLEFYLNDLQWVRDAGLCVY